MFILSHNGGVSKIFYGCDLKLEGLFLSLQALDEREMSSGSACGTKFPVWAATPAGGSGIWTVLSPRLHSRQELRDSIPGARV